MIPYFEKVKLATDSGASHQNRMGMEEDEKFAHSGGRRTATTTTTTTTTTSSATTSMFRSAASQKEMRSAHTHQQTHAYTLRNLQRMQKGNDWRANRITKCSSRDMELWMEMEMEIPAPCLPWNCCLPRHHPSATMLCSWNLAFSCRRLY